MIRVPNRHAAVFDPVQQAKQWETRILAEERALGLKPAVSPSKDAGGPPPPAVPLSGTVLPTVSDKKPAHYFNHRGLDRPPTAASKKSGGECV